MRILVTGATGNVGAPTAQALARQGHDVVAGVRTLAGPREDGVTAVVHDFQDPTSWDAALEGVEGLFLLRPPAISDVGPTLNAFATRAASRGVRHVVFLSVVGAGQVRFIPHRKVEDHLRTLDGVQWTFLRAGFFLQNLETAYRRDIVDDDRIFVPAGAGKVAWVDAVDLADAAAVAFGDPEASGQAWVLTGSEALDFAQVAALLSEVVGRTIRYEPAGAVAYALHLARRGDLPWGQIVVQDVLHTAIRLGREGVVDPTLQRLLRRPPTTVRAYLERRRARWIEG